VTRLRWLLQFVLAEQPWTPAVFVGGVSILIVAHFIGLPL
jgi:hypothetical protein